MNEEARKRKRAMKDRIYVCHTYYHVYVTFLKELALPKEKQGGATLVLSKMSTDFEQLKDRIERTGFFEAVIEYDEKKEGDFPELASLREAKANIVMNMIARIKFTKKFAALQAPYVPVDFKQYKDVYVYCDSDPIGYYLNQNKIYYHALEDGLNSVKNFDHAHYDNRGHFEFKAFMSKKMNLIFVQNGYGKYCLDMEVNDIEAIKIPCPYYVEVSRQELTDRLTREDKDLLLAVFVRDINALQSKINESTNHDKTVLLLTEPLCELDVRERIFRDLVEEYGKDAQVFIKPHPRDELDYSTLFADCPQFDGAMPMEILNFFEDFQFDLAVGVLTEMKAVKFAKEVVKLGPDFMDKYEAPEIHRQNERI